jgi:hypothetical protein
MPGRAADATRRAESANAYPSTPADTGKIGALSRPRSAVLGAAAVAIAAPFLHLKRALRHAQKSLGMGTH